MGGHKFEAPMLEETECRSTWEDENGSKWEDASGRKREDASGRNSLALHSVSSQNGRTQVEAPMWEETECRPKWEDGSGGTLCGGNSICTAVLLHLSQAENIVQNGRKRNYLSGRTLCGRL